MKKVKEIFFMDEKERLKFCEYSDGFKYILEDGTIVYTMTTDCIANRVEENKDE